MPCPSKPVLALWLEENLQADDYRDISMHIATCDTCNRVLNNLNERTEDELFRKLLPEVDRPVEPAEISFPSSSSPGFIGCLDHFDIEKQLGAGGMGAVYKAYDNHLRRWVAIKVLRPELAVASEFCKRFDHEARAMAAIRNDHVVPIHNVYSKTPERPFPYLVMELIEGKPLNDRLDREGKLSQREAVLIARDVTQGLMAIHEQKQLHRDIKPANILLNAKSGRAMIADFGVARTEALADDVLTQAEDSMGTPAYMSPEQLHGDIPLDGRSDIFSLGIVLFKMLTGKRPYEGEKREELRQQMQDYMPPRVRRFDRDIAPELETIVLVCLGNTPQDRFESAEALKDDLDRFLAHKPILCRPQGLKRRAQLFVHRNGMLVGVSSVAAALVVIVALGYSLALSSAKTEITTVSNQADTKLKAAGKEISAKAKLAAEKARAAEKSDRQEQATRYLADIKAAWRAWQENRPGETRSMLDRHAPPLSTDKPDLRGFEWYYLDRLVASSFYSLDFEGWPYAGCLSPDGRRLAVVGLRGQNRIEVVLWALPSTIPERQLVLAQNRVFSGRDRSAEPVGEQCVAFSPDGRFVTATAKIMDPNRPEGVVKVWDAASGQEIFSATDATIAGRAVCFSPDGRYLIAGGYDLAAFVWEMPSGQLRWTLPANDPRSILTSEQTTAPPPRPGASPGIAEPVVQLLFSGRGTLIRSIRTNRVQTRFPIPEPRSPSDSPLTGRVERLVAEQELLVSPTGHLGLYRDSDANAVHLDSPRSRTSEGKPNPNIRLDMTNDYRGVIRIDEGRIQCLAFAGGGIVVGQEGGRITYMEFGINRPELIHRRIPLPGHRGDVTSLSTDSAGGKLVAVGSEAVTLWDLEIAKDPAPLSLDRPGSTIQSERLRLASEFAPDGSWAASAIDHGFRVFDPRDSKIEPVDFTAPVDRPVLAAVNEDRTLCAICPQKRDGNVVYLTDTSGATRKLEGHTAPVTSCVFVPGAKHLLSSSDDATVRLWDTDSGQELHRYEGFPGAGDVAISPDGRWVIGSCKGDMYLWNIDRPESRDIWTHPPRANCAWAFHGNMLAATVHEGMIRIWDLAKQRTVTEFSNLGNDINWLVFIDDGRRLLAATNEKLMIWSVESGDLLLTIPASYSAMQRFPLMAGALSELEASWKKASAKNASTGSAP